VAGTSETRRGLVQLSMENVLAWNPETIVTWDAHFFERV
jgi:ABC-type Fe3+-hydroxamate transport system substrate-binding protein